MPHRCPRFASFGWTLTWAGAGWFSFREFNKPVPQVSRLFETWVNVNLDNFYIPPPAVVSWWKGDIHLPPFLCQIELANILPGTFVPLQVASCMAS